MVSKVLSAMAGSNGARILVVEADVSGGLPDIEMTGNLGSLVKDGKERIRVAIKKSGYNFPQGRVTINIAPAALHKSGTGFDIAMACAILEETGVIAPSYLEGIVLIGELTLDGAVKGIRGALPIVLEAKRCGCAGVIVAAENYEEACLVDGIKIMSAECLNDIVDKRCVVRDIVGTAGEWNGGGDVIINPNTGHNIDFADVFGQEYAKRAVLAAAAGMHNLMLLGPPGAGKTMLAERIPTIMPDLTRDEGLELTCIYSIAGKFKDRGVVCNRPFRAPHHTITPAAFAGGGHDAQPGEVSLASKGVLFLDEITKYRQHTVEILREPLESGKIVIDRLDCSCILPADFMLVAAMNPCKCGFYPDRNKCRCSINEINRNYGRLSRPILDRIDMSVSLKRISYEELTGENTDCGVMTSATMKKIVENSWNIQYGRLGKGRYNSRMTSEEIRKYCVLDTASREIMRRAYDYYGLGARAYHKVLKVARTLADMEGAENISRENILEALSWRVKEREEE